MRAVQLKYEPASTAEARAFKKFCKGKLPVDPGPVDVLRAVMNWHLLKGRLDKAAKFAKDLAVYTNARPLPVDHEGKALPLHFDMLTDAQLDKVIVRLQEGIARGIIDGRTGQVDIETGEPVEPPLQ
jgi:hypothetical protein